MVLPTFPERKVGRRRHIPRLNEGSVRLRYDNNIEGKRNFYSQKLSLADKSCSFFAAFLAT